MVTKAAKPTSGMRPRILPRQAWARAVFGLAVLTCAIASFTSLASEFFEGQLACRRVLGCEYLGVEVQHQRIVVLMCDATSPMADGPLYLESPLRKGEGFLITDSASVTKINADWFENGFADSKRTVDYMFDGTAFRRRRPKRESYSPQWQSRVITSSWHLSFLQQCPNGIALAVYVPLLPLIVLSGMWPGWRVWRSRILRRQ